MNDESPQSSPSLPHEAKRRQMSLRTVVIAVPILVAIPFASCAGLLAWVQHARQASIMRSVQHPETGYDFPPIEEIASIHALICTTGDESERFRVPERHWPDILAALSPSQIDPLPCAWQVLGVVWIETEGGGEIGVTVFETGEPVGAFDVDEYYRGGNTQQFMAAIHAAEETATNRTEKTVVEPPASGV